MSKIRIAASSIFYPVHMGGYMLSALERRNDVELFTVGPFTGEWIPWNSGLHISAKYIKTPNIPLPMSMVQQKISAKSIEAPMPWKPDLFLIIDAGWHFLDRPDADQVILICTDPHVLAQHYKLPRTYVDKVFNMQNSLFGAWRHLLALWICF